MASFKLEEIIDGHTLRVSPSWRLGDDTGNMVRIFGYKTPSAGQNDLAMSKLKILLTEALFELKDAREARSLEGQKMVVCSVYLNGVDIIQYFPEFRSQK